MYEGRRIVVPKVIVSRELSLVMFDALQRVQHVRCDECLHHEDGPQSVEVVVTSQRIEGT